MIKHPRPTWILVAHRTGASVYESPAQGEPLQNIETLTHPEGRLKASEVESDRPGRSFDRVGGGRHSLSSEESVPDHIERAFALQLAERLEQGRRAHAFDRLVLIAPPRLLGMLRDALSTSLQALVVASVDKDLTRLDSNALREELRECAAL